jgi:predicted nucleotidyltransferase component of viral defense system
MDTSIKAKIKNIAKEKGVSSQEVLRIYLFEHFLLRLSKSSFRENFILKGGGLLAQIFGQWQRTTRDLDATIKGIALNEKKLLKVIKEIIAVEIDDKIKFSLKDINGIHKDDICSDLRVSLNAKFGKINENISIDITAGDIITPKAITFGYKMMFEDYTLKLLAHNTETIIAEKFETIIARGVLNTRAKDFYDIYMLVKINDYDKSVLKKAVEQTFRHRNSEWNYNTIRNTIEDLSSNNNILDLWKKYQKTYKYAENISIDDIIANLKVIEKLL